jgi:hypothetical protein
MDTLVQPGLTYSYWLETVTLQGSTLTSLETVTLEAPAPPSPRPPVRGA